MAFLNDSLYISASGKARSITTKTLGSFTYISAKTVAGVDLTADGAAADDVVVFQTVKLAEGVATEKTGITNSVSFTGQETTGYSYDEKHFVRAQFDTTETFQTVQLLTSDSLNIQVSTDDIVAVTTEFDVQF